MMMFYHQQSSTVVDKQVKSGSNLTIWKFSLFVILALCSLIYFSFTYQDARNLIGLFDYYEQYPASQERRAIASQTKYRKPQLILAWTEYFSDNLANKTHNGLQACDYQCTVTDDKRTAPSADAIVFHVRDLKSSDLPKNRSSNQLYVFFCCESPYHTGNGLEMVPKDFFNLTMTYRRDGDVFSPYGMLKKIDNNTSQDLIWNWKEVEEIALNKTKMALQLVSNCITPSKREKYVEQLKLFVNVTRRGDCNGMSCDRECARDLAAEHRFYLSFENSVCRDYITEKLFHRMEELLVPIVLKKSLYIDTLPPGSYIAVDDFASPRELASYLKYLEENTTAYLRYFEWTKHYQKSTGTNGYCTLCRYLHQHAKDTGPKIIRDIESWWYGTGQCISDYALQFLESSHE